MLRESNRVEFKVTLNDKFCSLIKATHQVLEKMKIENITKAQVTSLNRIEKNLG